MDAVLWDRLEEALGAGDDEALWRLASTEIFSDVERLFAALETPPRHAVLTLARVPQRHPELHPDDAAEWRLSWSRERGDADWRPAGSVPRLRRRRGFVWITACVPSGTRRLAAAQVVVLWRPRAPWAGPDVTEIGREVRTYLRDPDGAWQSRGVREA